MRWLVLFIASLSVSSLAMAQDGTREISKGDIVFPTETKDGPGAVRTQPAEIPELIPIEERPAPSPTDAKYIPFLWERARAFHFKGHYKKACDDFDEIVRVGGDVGQDKPMVGRSYLECARELAVAHDLAGATKRCDQARSYLGEVFEMGRIYGEIARHESETALSKGDLAKAMEAFDRALKNEPDATDPVAFSADLVHFGKTAVAQKNFAAAKKAAEGSLHYFPDNREAKALLSDIWLKDRIVALIAAAVIFVFGMIGVFIAWRRVRAQREFRRLERGALSDDMDEESGLGI